MLTIQKLAEVLKENGKQPAQNAARKLVHAMRRPTDEMIAAGRDAVPDKPYDGPEVVAIWKAMIEILAANG